MGKKALTRLYGCAKCPREIEADARPHLAGSTMYRAGWVSRRIAGGYSFECPSCSPIEDRPIGFRKHIPRGEA